MKFLYSFFLCVFLVFIGCKHEPSTTVTSKEGDTLNTSNIEVDTSKGKVFESDKWVSLTEESTESSNALGYVPSKRKVEKRLEKEFATIDPLEYYLSENNKFSDKKVMQEKRKKIENLNKIYNTNYYDLGHIPERRNNANMMLSLTNTTYPLSSYASMSNDFAANKNRVDLKSGSKKRPTASAMDLKSILNNGVQLINLSELPEAEETMNYLENNGLSKEYLLYYNKAFIRYKYSDFYEAIRNSEKAITFRKDFYLGYLLIGDSYLSLGKTEKAYDNYSKAFEIKENIVALERVGYAALLLGKSAEAESCYSKILEKYNGKDRINYMASYAMSLAFNNKHDLSLKTVKQLKGLRKDWFLPCLIQGWNELLMSNYELSEKSFNEADKNGEKLYSALGKALGYYSKKDYSAASTIFYGLELNPCYKKLERNKELLMYSAYSYANVYDFRSAFEKFNLYSRVTKKDDCYYIGMSLCSFGFDDYLSAEAYLDSVGIQTNNLSEYYYLKGVYALRNGKYQNAKGSFEKSLAFNKNNLHAINGLGAALKWLESYQKSISVFDDGLKLKPNDPYLLFNKASAVFNIAKQLHEKGSNKLAADTLKYGLRLMNQVSAIDPSIITDVNIGNAYASIKDSSNALVYYKKVNNLASDVNIGALYASYNLTSKARIIWEQVKSTDTSYTLAAYNIKAIDMTFEGNSKRGARKSYNLEKYQYYENYYFDIGYHWKAPIPVLYECTYEPLVPLGYANLKFTKISN